MIEIHYVFTAAVSLAFSNHDMYVGRAYRKPAHAVVAGHRDPACACCPETADTCGHCRELLASGTSRPTNSATSVHLIHS